MKQWVIEYKTGSAWIQFAMANTWEEARRYMQDIRFLREFTAIKVTRIRRTA